METQVTPRQRILNKVAAVKELAKTLYGVDLSVVHTSFDLKGRVAGYASWRMRHGVSTYRVRFNHDMISRGDPAALKDMEEDTVPHELAHIVCYMNPTLGRNHDYGWQRVCRALGGTGKRTHDTDVVYGKGTTYEYTTDRGHKVRLSDKRHHQVQAGIVLHYRKGLGTVSKTCAFSIVGHRGQTLAKPIPVQAPNHPAQIETAVREAQPDAAEMARRAAMVEELRRRQLVTKPAERPTPVPAPAVRSQVAYPGESKAATSRRIMLSGYNAGHSYETIIGAMITVNGYDRALARATFKANAPKVGIPTSFYS